jgi:glycosyltransferase involved in cell wall biosynthesis
LRIAIVTSQVPFITGGAEYLAASLKDALIDRGHLAEIVSLPFKWYPPERVLDAMVMARLADLTEVNGVRIDRLITLKFPAYYVAHQNKVGWFLHQHRQAYDLFGTQQGDLHQSVIGKHVAAEVRRWDGAYIPEHKKVFTISKTVTTRLRRHNALDSEVLYPPPPDQKRLRPGDYDDYIIYPGRVDTMKRQHLIVQAMDDAPPGLRLVLFGPVLGQYADALIARIKRNARNNVEVLGPISVAQKIELYANCLAVYNGVMEEDYGYITLEAFHCHKAVICHSDGGGPLEFVRDGENGFIVPPEPERIAVVLKQLWYDRKKAMEMGRAGGSAIAHHKISWEAVVERLV